MAEPRLLTDRLELYPLPAVAAAALPHERETAARLLAATLAPAWPQIDLLDVLPVQAAAAPGGERFGLWVMLERETGTIVGDVGFMGPPQGDGSLELGYSVIPDRRRRGYATEAAQAIVGWALRQPGVTTALARCDRDNEASVRTLERIGFERTGKAEGQLAWRFGSHSGHQ